MGCLLPLCLLQALTLASGFHFEKPQMHVYDISPGDTLASIAKANELTVEQLQEANPDLDDPASLPVGHTITVPLSFRLLSPTPQKILNIPRMTSVAGGEQHSLFLAEDGTVFTSGANNHGQLGLGTNFSYSHPQRIKTCCKNGVVNISAGAQHNLVITNDEEVYGWGSNFYSQLAITHTVEGKIPPDHFTSPANVIKLNHVKRVAAGATHSLAVADWGDLYAFGHNGFGQLANPNNTYDHAVPYFVDLQLTHKIENISLDRGNPYWLLIEHVAASTSYYMGAHSFQEEDFMLRGRVMGHSLVATGGGQMWSFGANRYGQLGLGDREDRYSAELLDFGRVNSIAAGAFHSAAVTVEGDVYATGLNLDGQLGLNSGNSHFSSFKQVRGIPTGQAKQVATGAAHTLVLTNDGEVWSFGYNHFGQLGLGHQSPTIFAERVVLPDGVRIAQIAAGALHSLLLTTKGEVYSCGYNLDGQLGYPIDALEYAPTPGGMKSGLNCPKGGC